MKTFVLVALSVFIGSTHASTERAQEWRFTVYLNDTKIGYHDFRVEGADDQRVVATDAQFDVKFLILQCLSIPTRKPRNLE